MVLHKTCRQCKIEKPLSSFRKNKRRKDKLHTCCKSCMIANERPYFNKPENKIKQAESHRKHTLKVRYGMTYADFLIKFAEQSGCCTICKRAMSLASHKSNSVVQDHDHSSGRNRDLLCFKCNAAIGLFDEVTDTMRSAIAYLEEHGKR